mgnify:CR=1 FL=1
MSKATLFKNITDTSTPFYRTVDEVLLRIKTGVSKELVEQIRIELDKGTRNKIKKSLPSICFSGYFTKRLDSAIIEHSGFNHKKIGTEKSAGTKLMSLDSFFNKPGLYEIEMGTPLRDVINMAGGFKKPVKALQIGGPLGGIVPVDILVHIIHGR